MPKAAGGGKLKPPFNSGKYPARSDQMLLVLV
jgi:hypothetical protein